MEARTQYTDLRGFAAADVSGRISQQANCLADVAEYLKLDTNKLELVGLSFYGVVNRSISLICVDKERSTEEKEYLVTVMIDREGDERVDIRDVIERLHVLVFDKRDERYLDQEIDREMRLSDYE